MDDEEIERELAALAAEYAAGLPGRAAEIAAAVARRDLEDARARAHRLRGTAGAYGFADVSDSAAAIEDALEATAPDWSAIDAHCARLVRSAANR